MTFQKLKASKLGAELRIEFLKRSNGLKMDTTDTFIIIHRANLRQIQFNRYVRSTIFASV